MTQEKKSNLRKLLMNAGIALAVIVSAWMYLTSGRYMETDNAYVRSDIVSIAPDISGTITTVEAKDNQHVKKGDLLFTIDQSAYKIALSLAEANLVTAQTDIEALKARYRQKEEDLKISQYDANLASKQYDRRAELQKRNSMAVSVEDVDKATAARNAALQRVSLLEQERAEILAALNGNPDIAITDHPKYQAALAARDRAALDLQRTEIRALIDGTTGTTPKPGDYARASVPAMNLVNDQTPWIEANFKETELTNMRPGQNVEIKVDTYPSRTWKGKVESISPASGAEFSVLPAQNATGNWVKVVQRIPVRIAIDQEQDGKDLPLISGMSSLVSVDTGHWYHMPSFMQ